MKTREKKVSSHAREAGRATQKGIRIEDRWGTAVTLGFLGERRSRWSHREDRCYRVTKAGPTRSWESTVFVEEWELEVLQSAKKLGRKILPGVSPSPRQLRRPAETEQSVVSRPTSPSSLFPLPGPWVKALQQEEECILRSPWASATFECRPFIKWRKGALLPTASHYFCLLACLYYWF